MKKLLTYSFLFICWMCSSTVLAQQIIEEDHDHEHHDDPIEITDTTGGRKSIVQKEGGSANRGVAFTFYDNLFNVGTPLIKFIDTISHNIHRYNPIYKDNMFRTNRGNIGLITQNIEYLNDDKPVFELGKTPFDLYRFSHENSPFYQVRTPYTELFYTLGVNKEQVFRAVHSQNIWRGINVGAEYRVINSPGLYDRTFTNLRSARVFTNYISRNRHFRSMISYYNNKFANNENGGINVANDSLEYAESDRHVIPVKLKQAENKWVENSLFMKQSYHFGWGRIDSIPGSGRNFGYLTHAMNINRYRSTYSDKGVDNLYYPNIYSDSLETFDSTFYFQIRNSWLYSIGDVTNHDLPNRINFSIGFNHNLQQMTSDSLIRHHYSQYMLHGRARIKLFDQLHIIAGLEKELNNNKEELLAEVAALWYFNRENHNENLYFRAAQAQHQASAFQRFYYSNHYRWDTSYNPVNKQLVELGLKWKGFHVKAEFTNISDYLYMTKDGFAQADESFSVTKFSLEKNFKFGIIGFDNRIVYQKASSEKYMHLPEFLTRNALYFDFVLLKKTPIQIGAELNYNSKYHADMYNPALASFYYQDEIQTGGFAYIDLFLNLKIQRANLFLKFENLTAGYAGYNYIMTPGYPIHERKIKFGVLWRFYD